MAQLTIYVPAELARKVRDHKVAVSQTCQAALTRKVRVIERDRQAELQREADRSREPAGAA